MTFCMICTETTESLGISWYQLLLQHKVVLDHTRSSRCIRVLRAEFLFKVEEEARNQRYSEDAWSAPSGIDNTPPETAESSVLSDPAPMMVPLLCC